MAELAHSVKPSVTSSPSRTRHRSAHLRKARSQAAVHDLRNGCEAGNPDVWSLRAVLVMIAAVPVLGLLNVFGQHATPVTYQSAAASLVIDSPAHVRGGLVFTTEIVITSHRQLHDARLYLDNGWFHAMTFNAVEPQPSAESAQGRWQVWDFGKIPAATAFHVWISWQTNPTNIGRHSQAVVLYDGGTPLMTARRTLMVFP